jgi:hypothetical protein
VPAPVGELASVQAVQTDPRFVFMQWTSPPCAGQGTTCLFIPVAPTDVHARFVKQD